MNGNRNITSKGGTASRPSSSGSNTSNADDQLPEGLKGLDKELIEKIQNEIVDSGDVSTNYIISNNSFTFYVLLTNVCPFCVSQLLSMISPDSMVPSKLLWSLCAGQ